MATEKKTMQEHLGFRVQPEVLIRLDKLAKAMSVRFSALGFNLSRADAARAAMMSGLPMIEREYGVEPSVEPRPEDLPSDERGHAGSPKPSATKRTRESKK